jgi:hypothetical protein
MVVVMWSVPAQDTKKNMKGGKEKIENEDGRRTNKGYKRVEGKKRKESGTR